jgi:hypothetical protein
MTRNIIRHTFLRSTFLVAFTGWTVSKAKGAREIFLAKLFFGFKRFQQFRNFFIPNIFYSKFSKKCLNPISKFWGKKVIKLEITLWGEIITSPMRHTTMTFQQYAFC